MADKQAKILSKKEIIQVLAHIEKSRYPLRDKVMFLLSIKAGLRAKEISHLCWSMVTDASAQISDAIHLPDKSSKEKSGIIVPFQQNPPALENFVISSERGNKMLPCNISHWF